MVEGAGEFSPDTKPKASNGEYFLRGWGRSGGFWGASNPDGRGSGAGAGLVEGFLSGELDVGVRISLWDMPSDLVRVSNDTGVGSAIHGGSSRFLNPGIDFWGFGG